MDILSTMEAFLKQTKNKKGVPLKGVDLPLFLGIELQMHLYSTSLIQLLLVFLIHIKACTYRKYQHKTDHSIYLLADAFWLSCSRSKLLFAICVKVMEIFKVSYSKLSFLRWDSEFLFTLLYLISHKEVSDSAY